MLDLEGVGFPAPFLFMQLTKLNAKGNDHPQKHNNNLGGRSNRPPKEVLIIYNDPRLIKNE